MGYGRIEAKSPLPGSIFILSYEGKHKIYSNVAPCKAAVTSARNDRSWYGRDVEIPKIFEAVVTEFTEIEY
jgi:hypothetical protein